MLDRALQHNTRHTPEADLPLDGAGVVEVVAPAPGELLWSWGKYVFRLCEGRGKTTETAAAQDPFIHLSYLPGRSA